MSRRDFLSACAVLIVAWVAGIKKADYRVLLSRIPQPGFVNIQDYGAIGDGLHDDGPAIRRAIAAAASAAVVPTIIFPSGNYMFRLAAS